MTWPIRAQANDARACGRAVDLICLVVRVLGEMTMTGAGHDSLVPLVAELDGVAVVAELPYHDVGLL
eukprot:1010273-Pyramimonas_sp.AAC.1